MSVELRAPTFSESVAIENYTSAMKGALSSADSLADKIVTAAVSVGTAYGAAIALVAPKDSPAPWEALAPLAALATALGLALYAQSIGISIAADEGLETIQKKVSDVISAKRNWARAALGALVLGLMLAGAILYAKYGPNAEKEATPTAVRLYFTPAGTTVIKRACAKDLNEMIVKVDDLKQLTEERIKVTVGPPDCPSNAGTLVLPQRAIATAKY
jgi:hypothetical protein